MSTKQVLGFGKLYSGMWRFFASCYGWVLGWGLLFGVISGILWQVIPLLSGLIGLPGRIASAVVLLSGSVVLIPIAAYLKYDVLQRARQKAAGKSGSPPERAKPKMYGNLVLIGLFTMVLFLPSNILFFAALPTEITTFEFAVIGGKKATAIKELIQDFTHKYQAEEKDEKAESGDHLKKGNPDALAATLKTVFFPTRAKAVLIIVSFVAWFITILALLTWMPWALLALLDPRTDVTTAGAALRYARELTAGTCSGAVRWSIFWVSIIVHLISFGSILLCCIGFYLLGLPLLFAFGPGLYLAMRGE